MNANTLQPPKTTAEIIHETVEYYSADSSLRALNEKGSCEYITVDGRKCAVGRYLNEKSLKEAMRKTFTVRRLAMHFIDKELEDDSIFPPGFLKPEYEGHSIDFWNALQKLHDEKYFWNEDGLSAKGRNYVERLKEQFSSQNIQNTFYD